jgi:phenylacetate-coenzyme A ligase PaaK-like adenylate-forming protein
LEEYQLKNIIKCCKFHGIDVSSWGDFFKLPITTKKDLPSNVPTKKFKKHETSGSTGEPRIIYVPTETWYRKDAIFSRSWMKMGRKREKVLRLMAGEPSYPFYDWLRNVKPMNYRNVGQKHVDWLIKNKPFLIHGPGGAIRQLCELVIEQGHGELLKEIKIHWCSESSHGHRQRLEPLVKEFHEQYGLAEMPTVAATDGLGNLKIVEEKCYVEIVDDEDNAVPDGVEGFIIVTDFNNDLTPIIRYKSGDRGKIERHKNYRVLRGVIGRGVDFYNGPEVKRPVGWWVVSPISHTLGHLISQWRVVIKPKVNTLELHYKGKAKKDHPDFEKYKTWVFDNLGLTTKVVKSDEIVDYSIEWKNKLVRVITDE